LENLASASIQYGTVAFCKQSLTMDQSQASAGFTPEFSKGRCKQGHVLGLFSRDLGLSG
jgi:hypothetical protein